MPKTSRPRALPPHRILQLALAVSGIKQHELEQSSGLSRTHLSKLLNGRFTMQPATFERLVSLLGVPSPVVAALVAGDSAPAATRALSAWLLAAAVD